ncbi:hypothetical protein QBC35DRAFT_289107 [Podospora australis]|uniref:Uncharacterized protein n=1 Tax=Podospora australis TaxID=1536484 RepID=A0AAN6WSY8_9PEZI|nr:hypothetical protein QBC35DRAFT_289107 [Podospora australis]
MSHDTPEFKAIDGPECPDLDGEARLSLGPVSKGKTPEPGVPETTPHKSIEICIEDSFEDVPEDSELPSRSRSPSPWQTANSPDSEQTLVLSLWWVVNGQTNDSPQSQTSATSTPGSTGSEPVLVDSVEGASTQTAGATGSETSPPTQSGPSGTEDAGDTSGNGNPQVQKRPRDSQGSPRDSDKGDDESPSRKGFK